MGEPKLWKTTPIRQPLLHEAAFFQRIWLEDRLMPETCRKAATSLTVCRKKPLIERFGELREQHGFNLLHPPAAATSEEDCARVQYQRTAPPKREVATEFSISSRYRPAKGSVWICRTVISKSVQAIPVGIHAAARCFPPSRKMLACAGWSRARKSIISNSPAVDALGDVPEPPEPAASLFCGKMINPQNGEIRRCRSFSREGAKRLDYRKRQDAGSG